MLVQYKSNTYYLCNALRQKYGVSVCQNIPSDPVDQAVLEALFQALIGDNYNARSRPGRVIFADQAAEHSVLGHKSRENRVLVTDNT
jgi:hypothetical protein